MASPLKSLIAPIEETFSALYGTLRLARGDVTGMSFFNVSYDGFLRSFTAAFLIAPLYIALLLVRYIVSDNDIELWRYVSVNGISYVIGWTLFPLAIFYLCEFIGVGAKFIRYIVAYNWASVIQNLVYLPFALLVEAHMIQGAATTAIGFALLLLVMAYTWFVTRTALATTGFTAAGIVIIDFLISIFLNSTSQGLLRPL